MIKTASIGYILINKLGYENKPCIPLKIEEGKLQCLSFMSRDSERLVLVERSEVSEGELTQQTLI